MKSIKSIPTPAVDYRRLTPRSLSGDEYKHLRLLLFWPIFGLLFWFTERLYPAKHYYTVHCRFDDRIPFCEWFLIPYLFWFVYMVGMHLYTLFYDVDAFRRMMRYIIFTYSVTLLIYLLFPTCQELRPTEFARDNLLTRTVSLFYRFDTNTNVCPSLHVIGSLAVTDAALYSETIRSKRVKAACVIAGMLICISTVFMKQHSLIDLIAALPICLIAHHLCYRKDPASSKYVNA